MISPKNKSVGYLEQEPQLDSTKTVLDIVKEGIQDKQYKLNRYDEIWDILSSVPEEESIKLNNEVALLQEEIDAENLWEIDRRLDMAMNASQELPDGAQIISSLEEKKKSSNL